MAMRCAASAFRTVSKRSGERPFSAVFDDVLFHDVHL
jgi:hypothetical protein